MNKPQAVIRMGAAHWDATVAGMHFNFREMTKDERRDFHAKFMAAYRATHPMYANARKRRTRKPRRAN